MEDAPYCFIPEFIIGREDLNANEMFVTGIVIGLSGKTGFCYASNEYIASVIKSSTRSVTNYINHLVELGVLKRELITEKNLTKRALTLFDIERVDAEFSPLANGATCKNNAEPKTMSQSAPLADSANHNIYINTLNSNSNIVKHKQLPIIELPVITTLTVNEIYEISKQMNVYYETVYDIYKELKDNADNGGLKKPCKNFKLTLRNWIRNAIKWDQVSLMDEMTRQVNEMSYSPEGIENRRLSEIEMRKRGFID